MSPDKVYELYRANNNLISMCTGPCCNPFECDGDCRAQPIQLARFMVCRAMGHMPQDEQFHHNLDIVKR